jgi:DUF917 family protein
MRLERLARALMVEKGGFPSLLNHGVRAHCISELTIAAVLRLAHDRQRSGR